jgi:putative transposase
MKLRKFPAGEIFHVFNRSIAKFGIFRNFDNSLRFYQALDYYNNQNIKNNLGKFLLKNKNYYPQLLISEEEILIKFLAYCIMPDHYHLLVKVLTNNCLSKYVNDIENSYTRFFNTKLKRKGPLWESNFKVVRVTTNEQLLHLTRYIHLNPTTANLVNKPEDWSFSSYKNYITDEMILKKIITELSINSMTDYKKFVENQKDYQRELKYIKRLILE